VSAAYELTGLPLYDAAITAVITACDEAQATLAHLDEIEDKNVALALCAEISRAFADVERGLRTLRLRAETRGGKLFREGLVQP